MIKLLFSAAIAVMLFGVSGTVPASAESPIRIGFEYPRDKYFAGEGAASHDQAIDNVAFRIEISKSGETMDAVLKAVSDIRDRLVSEIGKQDVDSVWSEIINLNVSKTRQRGKDRTITEGFIANATIQFNVSGFADILDTLLNGLDDDVARISHFKRQFDDNDETLKRLKAEALERAIADAKEKARVMNVELTDAIDVRYNIEDWTDTPDMAGHYTWRVSAIVLYPRKTELEQAPWPPANWRGHGNTF